MDHDNKHYAIKAVDKP